MHMHVLSPQTTMKPPRTRAPIDSHWLMNAVWYAASHALLIIRVCVHVQLRSERSVLQASEGLTENCVGAKIVAAVGIDYKQGSIPIT